MEQDTQIQNKKQPKNIFEQTLFGTQAVNENIMILSENLSVINQKVDQILQVLMCPPIDISTKDSEPNTSGADTEIE